MYRKYYLVEVVLLLLLSHSGWNGPSVTLLSCTSESSKLVRDVVQKRFLSVVERYRVPLPLECPLHPRRDMFWWLKTELEASRVPGEDTWHCPVCGQTFRCENTFATHWDAKHVKRMGMAEETVCLDDYCDVFRCDVLLKRTLRQRLEEDEELGRPGEGTQRSSMRSVSLYLQTRPTQHDDEEIKEKKKSCDPQAMDRIHHKCRSLIRQCTIGMLANLSSKDFQDIEDDLDQSICSFLTCDKYWDDYDLQIHQVPMLVIAILGLLVISLFCFCYYGLWLILEKYPINSSQLCCNCQKPTPADIRHRQKLMRRKFRHTSPEYHSKHISSDYTLLHNSLDANLDQTVPDSTARQNLAEQGNSRKNSPEYTTILRQNSPEYNSSRHNSPEYNSSMQNEYDSRQNSPEYISRQNSPEYISRQNSPEYISRQNSPEYISRQNSPEYSSRQNSPEYISRQNSTEYMLRQQNKDFGTHKNAKESYYRHNSPGYKYLRTSPYYEYKYNGSKYGELYPEIYLKPKRKELDFNENACEISKYIQGSTELHKSQNKISS